MTTCDRCGETYDVGEWPWCPHGVGSFKAIADSIPGGMVLHNLGHTPVRVDSHSERKRIAAERGLSNVVCHVDGDQHVGRMV